MSDTLVFEDFPVGEAVEFGGVTVTTQDPSDDERLIASGEPLQTVSKRETSKLPWGLIGKQFRSANQRCGPDCLFEPRSRRPAAKPGSNFRAGYGLGIWRTSD